MVKCKNIELKTAIVLDQVLFRSTPINFFPIDKDGFSPLHVAMRAFDWFLKTRTYGNFKYHEARYILNYSYF